MRYLEEQRPRLPIDLPQILRNLSSEMRGLLRTLRRSARIGDVGGPRDGASKYSHPDDPAGLN